MDNYTKLWIDMDADELQTWEREVTRRLEDAKAEVTTQEQALAAIRTELRRRKIAAFWQANEGLRLEVGDKLLADVDYPRMFPQGHVTQIQYIWIGTTGELLVEVGGGALTTIPLDIARRMRLAYLQAHGEAQP